MQTTVTELAPLVGTRAACRALGVSRATLDRHRRPKERVRKARPTPPRALGHEERTAVLATLHEERFVDASPAAVYATLLDEGTYLCSERTMYRILSREGEVCERRAQRTHPPYARPELLATRPNEVWSWDITKLKGPAKWTYFYLYVVLDLFSRYVVGWTVQHRESAAIARALIAQAADEQHILPGTLTVHADRGSAMIAKPLAFLLADLGISQTHTRPYTSSDNPYSEAQFRTLKYRPGFPAQFSLLEEARSFCREFFPWYNEEHRHSGIGLFAPTVVHHGKGEEFRARRQAVLDEAHARTPERFVNGHPVPPKLPAAVWINKPETEEVAH